MALLEVKDITKTFSGLVALDAISLEVEENTITGLIGPNGCGKTTLFNVISGVLKADSGSITFNDLELIGKSPHEINKLGVSRTYQDTRLFQELSVIENLMLPPRDQIGEKLHNVFARAKELVNMESDLLDNALEILDLLEIRHMGYELAKNLSGGQSKLVNIGRVLMNDPKILLLDEPTAGVNPVLTQKLFQKIVELRDKYNLTIFLIEHNMDVVLRHEVDWVHVANMGKTILSAKPDQIRKDQQVIQAYLGR
jgi:ABC-type branched-subunit amino acid transport system ATPase component